MDVVVRVTKQTQRALFVTDGEYRAWIPKSVARTNGWNEGIVSIPVKIAEFKGLCTPWNWEPVQSTQDATWFVLKRYGYASRQMTEWLNNHEKRVSVWLERQRKAKSNGPNRMLRLRKTKGNKAD